MVILLNGRIFPFGGASAVEGLRSRGPPSLFFSHNPRQMFAGNTTIHYNLYYHQKYFVFIAMPDMVEFPPEH